MGFSVVYWLEDVSKNIREFVGLLDKRWDDQNLIKGNTKGW